MSDLVAVHVVYSGRVQGVGFRATAESLARHFAVTGEVRNLPDGRVELTAEGPRGELERFLLEVRATFGRNIRHEQIDWIDPTGRYPSFAIAR